jgi:dihydroorotate dehydrogenase (NAD+) catalytic subunit
MASRLETEIAGIKLANPTMLAAGILGMSSTFFKRIVDTGAGAIVTKSIGLKARKGYANPTLVEVPCGVLNAMGLPNPGIKNFVEEIREAKKIGVPIIVSIFGFSADEFVAVAKEAAKNGADALELNVSCPHIERAGAEIGQHPQLVAEVVNKVKKSVNVPVIVKLTPNVNDICEVAIAAANAGAGAITAINTVRAMAIDVETTRPILANKIGGLSGSAIKPIALRCVFEIYRSVKVPLIGCGGIANWQDAVEFFLAGASAVQIGTAIALNDVEVFRAVSEGIEQYLRRKSFENVKEIVGLAYEQ